MELQLHYDLERYLEIVAKAWKLEPSDLKTAYLDMLEANFEQDINDIAKEMESENE